MKRVALAWLMCASGVLAQSGSGLSATPRSADRAAPPYFTAVAADEETLSAGVFKSARWQAFVEVVQREFEVPVEPEIFEATCRRAVHHARLMSAELLIDDCIGDVLTRLDPEASYVRPSQFASQKREARRKPGSFGLEIEPYKRYGEPLVVISPIAGGPAARAGILAGDAIESIDGADLKVLAFDDVLDTLRGEPGSSAAVRLRRGDQVLELPVRREVVKYRTVRVVRLPAGVLYVRVARFRADATVQELLAGVEAAAVASPRPRLWVLDLRRNSGGALSEVAAAASLFTAPGVTVMNVSSRAGTTAHKTVAPADAERWRAGLALLNEVPLVVLVDGGTGSGAEVLAQLLQDRRHARIVGAASAQANQVTQSFDLAGQAAVRITVGRLHAMSALASSLGPLALDAELPTTDGADFGDPATDTALAAAIERFGR